MMKKKITNGCTRNIGMCLFETGESKDELL